MQQIFFTVFSSFKEFPYLPRWTVLLIDISISIFAFTTSYLICYQLQHVIVLTIPFLLKLLTNTVVTIFFFLTFRTYIGIIRYSSFMDGLKILLALFFANAVMLTASLVTKVFFGYVILVESGFFINFALTFSLIFVFRMFVKIVYDYVNNDDFLLHKTHTPLLIFGVTPSTVSIAQMIKNNSSAPFRIVGFISPDPKTTDKLILNEPVFSMNKEDAFKIKKKGAKALLVNPVELEIEEKQIIVDYCIENNIQMVSPPPVSDWINGQLSVDKIKNIQIEELLGRVPIKISVEEISKSLEQKCVMITGAAGSIGSEIVRQTALFKPSLLLLCDIAESPLHSLQLEVTEKYPNLNFLPIICDVRNYERMEQIFKTYHPHHVYHAAAYKHVPLMENHPSESIYTNVFGSKNVADLAIKYNSEVFVMISTDKAVNPTNIMGASKRIAEMYIQSLFKHLENNPETQNKKTKFITTRFGNVLGSNGSVIPRFKEQIEKGGPVTVTHPDIIRYFMTISEACRLVLEAGNMGKGGEIFVFDMGAPVKIVDLAEKMIRLAGFSPYKDIDIKFIGLRPGEKLYEELLANEESTQPTYNAKIMIGSTRECDYLTMNRQLEKLLSFALKYQDEEVVKVMKELVPEFISANSNYEVLDKEK
ncbi:MAG: polysaccharide biosynthesis protein [Candidatus Azobacteroides sp.]|nr:polysaccharide biosynthesis protein [Candidatus Azobacteroides sp.]